MYRTNRMDNNNNNGNNNSTMMKYEAEMLYDPYVVKTLKSVMGANLIIDTTTGTIEGTLAEVKPDHIVLSLQNEVPIFIRIQQIVSIMPN